MWWATRFGRQIYKSPTGASVYDNGFYRWLKLGSPHLQTLLCKRTPSAICLPYLHPLLFMAKQSQGHVCLLGLGGAAALHALGSRPCIAVEKSAEVIDIATTYFDATHPQWQLTHADASAFMATTTERFEHILIDLAENNQLPSSCQTLSFFQNCCRTLTPSGTLALNCLSAHEHALLHGLLAECFHGQVVTFLVPKSANVVLLASHNGLISRLTHHRNINTLQWDRHWGYLAVV